MTKEKARDGWNAGYFLSGMFIGGLAGAVTALLVAPQSGEETREMIRDKGVEVRDKGIEIKGNVVDTAQETRARAEQAIADGRTRAGEMVGEVGSQAEGLAQTVQERIG
jgi:gas vesicle protein